MSVSPKRLKKVLDSIPSSALVLDVGGGQKPLKRANYVVDFQSYDEALEGNSGFHESGGTVSFTKDSWVRCNINEEPLPFENNYFDFVFCSHTLEDINNPQFALSEISRVGKRGYIETPSIKWELIRGIQLPNIVGAPHHMWYVECDRHDSSITFTAKGSHCYRSIMHHLPKGTHIDYEESEDAMSIFWEDKITPINNVIIGSQDVENWLQEKVIELGGRSNLFSFHKLLEDRGLLSRIFRAITRKLV